MVQMGMLAWLPYLTADLGAFGGGIASGWLIKRGYDPIQARKMALLLCALIMPLSVLVPWEFLDGRDSADFGGHVRAYGLENQSDDAYETTYIRWGY